MEEHSSAGQEKSVLGDVLRQGPAPKSPLFRNRSISAKYLHLCAFWLGTVLPIGL